MTDLETRLRSLEDGTVRADADGIADGALGRARRRVVRRRALGVTGTAVAAAALVVAVNVTAGRVTATPEPAARPLKPRETVLIIGSDADEGRIGVRPDTIVVASIDTRSGEATLIGVPRNLERAPFPAGSPAAAAFPRGFVCPDHACLLNQVWAWAEGSGRQYWPGTETPGLTATRAAVQEIVGVPIDETVTVTFDGLAALVDAVGGVTIDVRKPLPIGGNSMDPTAKEWLEPGRQRLTGDQAVWYARSRWSTDDYDRMRRQRCLLAALVDQTDGTRLATALPRLLPAIGDGLVTSIPAAELPQWAELLTRVRSGAVRTFGLDNQNVPDRANPDYEAIRATVDTWITGGDGRGLVRGSRETAC